MSILVTCSIWIKIYGNSSSWNNKYTPVFILTLLISCFSVCLSLNPKNVNEWRTQNSSFFELDFYRCVTILSLDCLLLKHIMLFSLRYINTPNSTFRLVDIKVSFQLNGINLQTVLFRELPDCYTFDIKVCLPYYLTVQSQVGSLNTYIRHNVDDFSKHITLTLSDGEMTTFLISCLYSVCLVSRYYLTTGITVERWKYTWTWTFLALYAKAGIYLVQVSKPGGEINNWKGTSCFDHKSPRPLLDNMVILDQK